MGMAYQVNLPNGTDLWAGKSKQTMKKEAFAPT